MDTIKDNLDINHEHPEYAARRAMWRQYRDLYVGGEQFKANAEEYLIRRQKEPGDVFGERLLRCFYENYVGSIVDWYAATLFRREAVLSFDGTNERAKKFFGEFTEDCDRRGSSLTEFFRKQFIEALICGKSYTLIDFPRLNCPAGTRAEEDERGASRAYLVSYSADELINWSFDEHGHYEWVVLRTRSLKKEKIEDRAWAKQTRWVYYDKEIYRIYEQLENDGHRQPIEVAAEGRHGLAKQARVPLADLRVSEGLWLLNKAGSLQLEHFNKSNALGWALTMGLFAMPVIYSERDWNQVMGESYYIRLGPQDRFGWTEPEGHVYQIASENLSRLQEEIYRVCHVTHAGGSGSGSAAQSGLSKQRDFAITQEVLRASNMTATGWYNVVNAGTRNGGFNLDFTDSSGKPLGEPDATSFFLIADSSWQFGASSNASPVSFVVPNREGATIQVSGRAANVRDDENAFELSPLTRWRISGAAGDSLDTDISGQPTFGLFPNGQGGIELLGIGFTSLTNTRTISAGTLVLAYWNELNGPSTLKLSAAIGTSNLVFTLTTPSSAQAGDLVQIDGEVLVIQQAVSGGTSFQVARGSHGSPAATHAAQVAVYFLEKKTFIMPFARDFFGSPSSGSYAYPVAIPDVRIGAAELFVTNSRGNSSVAMQAFTATTDLGLRTLSGGQVTIQVEGPLAIQTNAAPPLSMDASHSIRDVYAVVRDAATGGPIALQVTQNGQPYCQLTIPTGATISNVVNGFASGPLQSQAQIGLNITSVVQTANSTPGRDLTVTIRL